MMAQTALEKSQSEREAIERLRLRPTMKKDWHCEVCAYVFGVNYTDDYWKYLTALQKTMLMELGWNSFTFNRVRAFVESLEALEYFRREIADEEALKQQGL